MQNKLVLGAVAAIVVLGAIVVYAANRNSAQQNVADRTSKSSNANNSAMMDGDKMMEDEKMMKDDKMAEDKMKDDKMSGDKTAMAGSAGSYVDYSPEVLANAQAAQKDGRKVVLFFHAAWCPNCQAAEKAFKAALANDSFPQNITLIKTDYDSSAELKKKYGVNYQHTFVQIDSSGNQITKWVSGDTAQLSANVK
jgi:thioredoxin 1